MLWRRSTIWQQLQRKDPFTSASQMESLYSSAILNWNSSVLQSLSNQEVLNLGTEDWDGWPDGTIEQDFTYQEFEKTGNLNAHWAMAVSGGDRKGDEDALVWQRGKRSTRKCLGVIECDNPTCAIITEVFTPPPHSTWNTFIPQGIRMEHIYSIWNIH